MTLRKKRELCNLMTRVNGDSMLWSMVSYKTLISPGARDFHSVPNDLIFFVDSKFKMYMTTVDGRTPARVEMNDPPGEDWTNYYMQLTRFAQFRPSTVA